MLTSWHYLFSCYLLWVAATTKQRVSVIDERGCGRSFLWLSNILWGCLISCTYFNSDNHNIQPFNIVQKILYVLAVFLWWYLFSLSTYFSVTWAHARFHYSTKVSNVHVLLPFSGTVRKSEINKQHLCLLKLTTFFSILFLHSYHPHQSSSSPPLSLVSIIITIIIAAVVIIIFIVIIILFFRLKYAFSSWQ